jgi:hypothetical protein
MSQVGSDPPARASSSSNARLKTFAVRACWRPIGSARGRDTADTPGAIARAAEHLVEPVPIDVRSLQRLVIRRTAAEAIAAARTRRAARRERAVGATPNIAERLLEVIEHEKAAPGIQAERVHLVCYAPHELPGVARRRACSGDVGALQIEVARTLGRSISSPTAATSLQAPAVPNHLDKAHSGRRHAVTASLPERRVGGRRARGHAFAGRSWAP